MTDAPGPSRRWVLAARPRTLPAAGVPVVVGTLLIRPLSINWLNSVLCLVIALSLQVATNYANDYSDGVRGTDEQRVGPFRLTASRLVPARHVRRAAYLGFALACVHGAVARVAHLVVVCRDRGDRSIGGMVLYGWSTALWVLRLWRTVRLCLFRARGDGRHHVRATPHYSVASVVVGSGLGFHGLCALGSQQLTRRRGRSGCGKKTLAARLGRERSSWLYVICVAGVALGALMAGQLVVALVALVVYVPALQYAFSKRNGRELLPMLKYSARAQLQIGALLAVLLVSNAYWG